MDDGFFELQSATDLLEKLRHDFRLLQQDPMDPYRAFNFFVTAEHLVDWVYPGLAKRERDARQLLRNGSPLLRICSHLANGMKHFRAEAKHHTSVSKTTKSEGVYGDVYGNAFDNVFGREMRVQLDGTARQHYGDEINVVELASHVLQYWEQRVS